MVYSGRTQGQGHNGHNAMIVGIGLALSLGAVMWEKTQLKGKTIFQAYGLIGIIFLGIILAVAIFYGLSKLVKRGAGFALLMFFLFAFIFCLVGLVDPGYWFSDIAATHEWNFATVQTVFKWITIGSAVAFVITGIAMLFQGRHTQQGGG
ncbi:MAG: hypothetical protein AABX86_00285 [Nanoarchaeota archaeon]